MFIRNEKDIACIDDNEYSGCLANNTYPKKRSGEYNEEDDIFYKKGDKYNNFYIAGGEDGEFEAKMIEFYGIN